MQRPKDKNMPDMYVKELNLTVTGSGGVQGGIYLDI